MAQNEEKNEKVITNSPKEKKSVKKEYTKPQIEEVEKEYPEYHISKVGDNPFNLAKMYNTSIEAIRNFNPNIVWLNLKPGTKVRVK